VVKEGQEEENMSEGDHPRCKVRKSTMYKCTEGENNNGRRGKENISHFYFQHVRELGGGDQNSWKQLTRL